MRNLTYYFTNPFESPNISLAELVAFTSDHLERMTANNPGNVLNPRISATTTALAALNNSTTGDVVQLGIRKGVKFGKEAYRASLAEAIRPIYGAGLGAFNDPSAEMNNIFPNGRTVFSSDRDDQLKVHLDAMVSGVTLHQAVLGAGIVTQATDLRDQWVTLYVASEAGTGGKTATEQEKREARDAMQLELYLTLGELMQLFPRQPDKLGLYMQQHLLGGPATGTPGGGTGGGGTGGGGGDDTSSSSNSSEDEQSTSSSSSSFEFSSSSSSSELSSSSSGL